ncbi:MAG: glycosyltransferase family 2 protein [Bacteroidetes bacterium]|nr:glycosyltransferase family 2 protein [Bacteroidota bacterium]
MPKVSVIVTTYNRKELLTETIYSILTQTFTDFELIVVDNFSNYDFINHIMCFNDPRVQAFQNHNDGIIAVNRNYGINKACGEFLAFCDDDDIWISEKLQLQIIELHNNTADLVYSNTLLYSEAGKHRNSNYKPTNSLNRILFTNHITLSSVIVRNDPHVKFNEDCILTGIEDYELWVRLLLLGFKFSFIITPLVKYQISDSSFSRLLRSKNEEKIIKLKMALLCSQSELTMINKLFLCSSLLNRITRYFLFKLLNQ